MHILQASCHILASIITILPLHMGAEASKQIV